MKVVHHQPIRMEGPFTLQSDWTPVAVGARQGAPTIWYERPEELTRALPALYDVFGTGWPIPEDAEHVGTWQDGSLVWHLYRLVTA